MFRKIFIFCFLILMLPCWAAVAAPPKKRVALLEMTKVDAPGFSRISLVFPRLPLGKASVSGHRVDLRLQDTSLTPGLQSLPEDGEIVDVLLGEKNGEAILSFLVRRPVRRVELTPDRKTQTLYLDIFWDQTSPTSRPAIAFGLAGVPTLDAGTASVNRRVSSKYMGRWQAFFSEYETPLRIELIPHYSLAPFPVFLAPEKIDWTLVPAEVLTKGRQGLWGAALSVLEGTDGERMQQKAPALFQLAQGELKLRAGDPQQAVEILRTSLDPVADESLGP